MVQHMKYDLYEVGGRIRDEIMGLKSSDIDYTVVLENPKKYDSMQSAFELFVNQVKSEGFEVFLETPSMLTVRAKFPEDHVHTGTADFVIARREVTYNPNTREPICELGTLLDDLKRRDFTVNAIAKNELGHLVDPFGGFDDIGLRRIDTPGEPIKSFTDDPLRIIRALRFCVTKNFTLSDRVKFAIRELKIHDLQKKVSKGRIREELNKALKFDTQKTVEYLWFFQYNLNYPILESIFKNGELWLNITDKKK